MARSPLFTKISFDEYAGDSGRWTVSTSKDGTGWHTLSVLFPTQEAAAEVALLIEKNAVPR